MMQKVDCLCNSVKLKLFLCFHGYIFGIHRTKVIAVKTLSDPKLAGLKHFEKSFKFTKLFALICDTKMLFELSLCA